MTLNQQNVLHGTLSCQEYKTVVVNLISETDIFRDFECNNLITYHIMLEIDENHSLCSETLQEK